MHCRRLRNSHPYVLYVSVFSDVFAGFVIQCSENILWQAEICLLIWVICLGFLL